MHLSQYFWRYLGKGTKWTPPSSSRKKTKPSLNRVGHHLFMMTVLYFLSNDAEFKVEQKLSGLLNPIHKRLLHLSRFSNSMTKINFKKNKLHFHFKHYPLYAAGKNHAYEWVCVNVSINWNNCFRIQGSVKKLKLFAQRKTYLCIILFVKYFKKKASFAWECYRILFPRPISEVEV